jgi:hypothetical protein
MPFLPKRPGPPGLLTDSELLTLALLCHWGVWAFLRWAHAHLKPYFPSLGSQSRFNRRVRHLWCILGMLYRQSALLPLGRTRLPQPLSDYGPHSRPCV